MRNRALRPLPCLLALQFVVAGAAFGLGRALPAGDSAGHDRRQPETRRHRHGGAGLRHQPARRHEPPVRRRAERPAADHQNGALLPGAALDICKAACRRRSTPGNANDERGFLGLAFHPGFNNAASPGFRTLYTYTSEPIPAARRRRIPAPERRRRRTTRT